MFFINYLEDVEKQQNIHKEEESSDDASSQDIRQITLPMTLSFFTGVTAYPLLE
jgi:hypothetical protein